MDRTDNRGYRGRRGGFRGGFKRAREDEPVLDRGKVLLSTLLSIGDDCMPVRYPYMSIIIIIILSGVLSSQCLSFAGATNWKRCRLQPLEGGQRNDSE